jgi:hypothetical protein
MLTGSPTRVKNTRHRSGSRNSPLRSWCTCPQRTSHPASFAPRTYRYTVTVLRLILVGRAVVSLGGGAGQVTGSQALLLITFTPQTTSGQL